jgi:hypothetical protein
MTSNKTHISRDTVTCVHCEDISSRQLIRATYEQFGWSDGIAQVVKVVSSLDGIGREEKGHVDQEEKGHVDQEEKGHVDQEEKGHMDQEEKKGHVDQEEKKGHVSQEKVRMIDWMDNVEYDEDEDDESEDEDEEDEKMQIIRLDEKSQIIKFGYRVRLVAKCGAANNRVTAIKMSQPVGVISVLDDWLDKEKQLARTHEAALHRYSDDDYFGQHDWRNQLDPSGWLYKTRWLDESGLLDKKARVIRQLWRNGWMNESDHLVGKVAKTREEKRYVAYKVFLVKGAPLGESSELGSLQQMAHAYSTGCSTHTDRMTVFLQHSSPHTIKCNLIPLLKRPPNLLTKSQIAYLLYHNFVHPYNVMSAYHCQPTQCQNVLSKKEHDAEQIRLKQNASIQATVTQYDQFAKVEKIFQQNLVARKQKLYRLVLKRPWLVPIIVNNPDADFLWTLDGMIRVYYKTYPDRFRDVLPALVRMRLYYLIWEMLDYVSDYVCLSTPPYTDLTSYIRDADFSYSNATPPPYKILRKIILHFRSEIKFHDPIQNKSRSPIVQKCINAATDTEKKDFQQLMKKYGYMRRTGRGLTLIIKFADCVSNPSVNEMYKLVLENPNILALLNNPPEDLCDFALIHNPQLIVHMKQTTERIKRCMYVPELIPLFEDHIDYDVNPGHILYAYKLENILKALEINPDVWHFIHRTDRIRHHRRIMAAYRTGLIKKKIINETDPF